MRHARVLVALGLAGLGASLPSHAKDPARIAEVQDLWQRIDAAQAAERLDIPHRVVAEITSTGVNGEARVAVAARLWWSPTTGRDESQGPDGSHLRAVVDGLGWEVGSPTAGTTALRRALAPPELAAPEDPARAKVRRAGPDGECLQWTEGDPPVRRMACLRDGHLAVIESGPDRWELSGHAPVGDRVVARRCTLRRAEQPATLVVVRELEALEGPPVGVLDGRPPEALDADLNCVVVAPKLARRIEPEYPAAELRHGSGGTTVMQAVIDAEGSVTQLKVVSSAGSALLDQSARRAVAQWRYEPATCGGRPRPAYLIIRIGFRPGGG